MTTRSDDETAARRNLDNGGRPDNAGQPVPGTANGTNSAAARLATAR